MAKIIGRISIELNPEEVKEILKQHYVSLGYKISEVQLKVGYQSVGVGAMEHDEAVFGNATIIASDMPTTSGYKPTDSEWTEGYNGR